MQNPESSDPTTEIGCENVSCQKARSHEARGSGCRAELNVGWVGSLGGRQAKSGNRFKKKKQESVQKIQKDENQKTSLLKNRV